MGRLDGKVAFITGAAFGIGKATALLFAQEGAAVAFIDNQEQAGQATADEIHAAGGQSLFIHADVTQSDQVEAAIKQTLAKFGKLNILHNNVGGSPRHRSRNSGAKCSSISSGCGSAAAMEFRRSSRVAADRSST